MVQCLCVDIVLFGGSCSLQTGLYVFYTMVTQKYAIKSHLTSLLSSRNYGTIPISVYCKNCENTGLVARHPCL